MKRWAVLTVLLYAFTLLILTAPIMWVAFGSWAKNSISLRDILMTYSGWGYWLWLAVLLTGQALLLWLPLKITERRLPARRPLKIPVIVTAFFLANLFFAGVFSIVCAVFRDDAFDLLGLFNFSTTFNAQPANSGNSGWGDLRAVLLTLVCFWVIWAIVFRNFARSDEPDALLKRMTRWLLRGSILELLIAVPSHVIVRRREDCCAPAGTFWGIATGISVMLLCFGPGVYFLFVERMNRVKPKPPETNS
jgi:hypothetical protein